MLFLTFSVLVANPKKTTLHGGQSRSWSAEQGKKKSGTALPLPPRPRCSFGENKIKITRRIHMSRRYAGRHYVCLGSSHVRTRIRTTRRLRHWVSRFGKFYASVCDSNFPSLVASPFSWRCLAASSSSSLHTAMNLRPPSVTASTHTSAFNAIAFQFPVMPNALMSLCTQSVHSFSFPPRPLRTMQAVQWYHVHSSAGDLPLNIYNL